MSCYCEHEMDGRNHTGSCVKIQELEAELKHATNMWKTYEQNNWDLSKHLHADIDKLESELSALKLELEKSKARCEDKEEGLRLVKNHNSRLEGELNEFKTTVHKIWDALGNPSYQELNGRTLYVFIMELQARCERAEAIINAGHDETCGGSDSERGECGCGYLQREGTHQYILKLESDLAAARHAASQWLETANERMKEIEAAKKENEELRRIQIKENWLEWAEKNGIRDPYISYDEYEKVQKQLSETQAKLEEANTELADIKGILWAHKELSTCPQCTHERKIKAQDKVIERAKQSFQECLDTVLIAVSAFQRNETQALFQIKKVAEAFLGEIGK